MKTKRYYDYKVETKKGNKYVRAPDSNMAKVRCRLKNPDLKVSDIIGAKRV